MKKLIAALCLAFLMGAAVPVVLPGDQKASAQEEEQQEQQPSESEGQDVAYRYTAQPGDSYTLMARKAVQTYGLKNEVNLSLAQIIYAETKMTQEAGMPILEVGQQVEITESVIGQWVERAQELSDQEKSAWSHYAQYADFNTDNVGEER